MEKTLFDKMADIVRTGVAKPIEFTVEEDGGKSRHVTSRIMGLLMNQGIKLSESQQRTLRIALRDILREELK